METALIIAPPRELATTGFTAGLPSAVTDAGEKAARRFVEFFTARIRNRNTRLSYAADVRHFFDWCAKRRLGLDSLSPVVVAAYIDELQKTHAGPSVKRRLAAIRKLFDYLVTGGVVPFNPAAAVEGPRVVARKGKTPVLTQDEARELFESIDVSTIAGLRDRALLGVMVYTFARVSAVLSMRVEDYFQAGKRWRIRLHEKGGTYNEVRAHHKLEEFLDAYLEAAGIDGDKKGPLFRSLDRERNLTNRALHRNDVLRMVKRRALAAGLSDVARCHTFRATGITLFRKSGGKLEDAQKIAGHASPRTTAIYDHSDDEVSLDEIERIVI